MWTCSICDRTFKHVNQRHYCGDQAVTGFLSGKNETAVVLFEELIAAFEKIGPIKLHTTKSMIVISSILPFAYIIAIGKNWVDVVFPFKEPFYDNLCFRKIAKVPGSDDYNHHLRLMYVDDLNEEVYGYLKKAYDYGKGIRA